MIGNIILLYILGLMINILLNWLEAWSIIGLQYSTSASSWLWSNEHQNSWENLDESLRFHEVYVTHRLMSVYWNGNVNTVLRSLPMVWCDGSGLRALTHPAWWLEVDPCNPHCSGREPVPISCFLTSTYSITYVPHKKLWEKNEQQCCLSLIMETLSSGCGIV